MLLPSSLARFDFPRHAGRMRVSHVPLHFTENENGSAAHCCLHRVGYRGYVLGNATSSEKVIFRDTSASGVYNKNKVLINFDNPNGAL